jgi:hypothetical protein
MTFVKVMKEMRALQDAPLLGVGLRRSVLMSKSMPIIEAPKNEILLVSFFFSKPSERYVGPTIDSSEDNTS